MEKLSTEKANEIINGFVDPVDEGVRSALVSCMKIANVFSMETMSSCEGHLDWKSPYPSISFVMNQKERWITPLWMFWLFRSRLYQKSILRKISKNLEIRTSVTLSFLISHLVRYYNENPPKNCIVMFSFRRTGLHSFEIEPAFASYSRVLRDGGNLIELEKLLKDQRTELEKVSMMLLEALDSLESFEGIDQDACPSCQAAL